MNTIEAAPLVQEPFTAVLDWGIRIIEFLQDIFPAVAAPVFRTITILGDPPPYMIVIAFLYWCIDERHAARAGIILFFSAGINIVFKELLAVPRPFVRKPGINLIHENGYATPSGHAQNSAVFWPVMLHRVPGKAGIVAMIGLPLLIGASRVYLGVHYPTDVLFGWALGAGISVVALVAIPRIRHHLSTLVHTRFPDMAPVPASVRIAGIALVVFLLNRWSGGETRMSGLLFGFAAGAVLLHTDNVSFSAATGSRLKKILRCIAGGAGLAILYVAGNALPGLFPDVQAPLYRFVQYALIGFWTSKVAPMLFVRTGLQ